MTGFTYSFSRIFCKHETDFYFTASLLSNASKYNTRSHSNWEVSYTNHSQVLLHLHKVELINTVSIFSHRKHCMHQNSESMPKWCVLFCSINVLVVLYLIQNEFNLQNKYFTKGDLGKYDNNSQNLSDESSSSDIDWMFETKTAAVIAFVCFCSLEIFYFSPFFLFVSRNCLFLLKTQYCGSLLLENFIDKQ